MEQLALERNPTLVQALAQVGVSRGKAIEAGLYPNPTVGYAADQVGAQGKAGEIQGLFVQQEIVRGGKLGLSRAKYQQEEAQSQTQVDAQRFRVLSSVQKAFYQTLTTQRRVEVRRELVTNADDALTTTRGLVNVGQANTPDLLQAEVQAERARAELRAAERKYRGHWQELLAYVGVSELAPSPLVGALEVAESDVLYEQAVINELLQASPQLQAAWQEVARDRIALPPSTPQALKVVPHAASDLLLEDAEERELVAQTVVVVKAGSEQMTASVAAPCPPCLDHEVAAVVQFLPKMAVDCEKRSTANTGGTRRSVIDAELKVPVPGKIAVQRPTRVGI